MLCHGKTQQFMEVIFNEIGILSEIIIVLENSSIVLRKQEAEKITSINGFSNRIEKLFKFKMGLREVKTRLNNLEKTEILKLISEMYKKVPAAKDFLDIYATGDIDELVEKYKKAIEKYVYPSGNNLVLKESEARKLIRKVRKMNVIELNIEIELHYVDCCLDVISDFGYWEDNYYVSVVKMYYSAVNGIAQIGLIDEYTERLENISSRASEFGLELYL